MSWFTRRITDAGLRLTICGGFALLGLTPWSAAAQEFLLGSDGSYGAIDVVEDTVLPLPEDGVFHATTVTIHEGATLSFTRNRHNTGVTILATGDIVVDGTIDVSGGDGTVEGPGEGGPGGGDGGPAALFGTQYPEPLPYPCQHLDCNPPSGGGGGRGSYYHGTESELGCTLGSAGGGGGGALVLIGNTTIRGAGSIDAAGGGAGSQRPSGGGCTNVGSAQAAERGEWGFVGLQAPTVELAGLTLQADDVRVSAPFRSGEATLVAGPGRTVYYNTDRALTAYRPNRLAVLITAVDGVPVTVDEPFFYTDDDSAVLVEVLVTGCAAPARSVEVYAELQRIPSYFVEGNYNDESVSYPSGEDVLTIALAPDPEQTYRVVARARCDY